MGWRAACGVFEVGQSRCCIALLDVSYALSLIQLVSSVFNDVKICRKRLGGKTGRLSIVFALSGTPPDTRLYRLSKLSDKFIIVEL